jgi:hypothetical protein
MLAVAAEPFDSLEYCFEIKYDGIWALTAVDESGWRLWGRERADYTARFPELDVLRRLPAGTLVDGELVACDKEGRPDLRRLLRRHGLTDPCAQRADLARGTLEALAIPGGEDHLGPLSARSSGGFEPDAGTATDHDDGLSGEFRLARDGRGGGCGAQDSSNQQSESRSAPGLRKTGSDTASDRASP